MSNTNFQQLPVAVGLTGNEIVPIQQAGVTKRTTTGLIGSVGLAAQLPGAIEFVIDGGGGNINAQTWGYMKVPFNALITSAEMLGNTDNGSIIINLWKCTYAQFDAGVTHPTAADSITSATPPTLTAQAKSLDTALAGWTTTLSEGDVLAFNVPSVSTNLTRVTIALNLVRITS